MTHTQIVFIGVHHERAADHGVRAHQLDALVGELELGDAVSSGHHIAQVTSAADVVLNSIPPIHVFDISNVRLGRRESCLRD